MASSFLDVLLRADEDCGLYILRTVHLEALCQLLLHPIPRAVPLSCLRWIASQLEALGSVFVKQKCFVKLNGVIL